MADLFSGAGGAVVGAIVGAIATAYIVGDGSEEIARLNKELNDSTGRATAAEERAGNFESNMEQLQIDLDYAVQEHDAVSSENKNLIKRVSGLDVEVESLTSENARLQEQNVRYEREIGDIRRGQDESIEALLELRSNFAAVVECVGATMDFDTLPAAVQELGREKVTVQLLCAQKALERFSRDEEGYLGLMQANNGAIREAAQNANADSNLFILIKSILASQNEREQTVINSIGSIRQNQQ